MSKQPKWNEYPSVFLSPENKGFDVAKMMSEGIGIPLEFPAPLPWLPPTCKPFTGRNLIQYLLDGKIFFREIWVIHNFGRTFIYEKNSENF